MHIIITIIVLEVIHMLWYFKSMFVITFYVSKVKCFLFFKQTWEISFIYSTVFIYFVGLFKVWIIFLGMFGKNGVSLIFCFLIY